MNKKKIEIQHQIDSANNMVISKKKEIENLEFQLSMAHQNASEYTHVPPKIQLEIKNLDERIQTAKRDLVALVQEIDKLQGMFDGTNDIDYSLVSSPVEEAKINYAAIFFGGLLICLILATIWLDIQTFYPMFTSPVVFQQILDPNFHHLGDNSYSVDYINSISGDKIHNLSSEGLTYHTTFDLQAIRHSAQVSDSTAIKTVEMNLYVNALKPRETASVIVGINGQLVTYLNDLITREEFRRTKVNILLDVPLYNGQNEVQIITGKDLEQSAQGFDEYEDFEFDNLALVVTFDTTRLNPFPFLGVVAVELIILGIVFGLLRRNL